MNDSLTPHGGSPISLNAASMNTQTSINILNLADELIIHIASSINPYIDDPSHDAAPASFARSLLNFGLASKRLFEICEPVLYTYIQNSASKPTLSILRPILRRPDLARHVLFLESSAAPLPRHLVVLLSKERLLRDTVYWRNLIRGAVDKLESQYKEVLGADNPLSRHFVGTTLLKQRIENGFWEGIMSFMIALLPNLQAIRFTNWSCLSRGLARGDIDYIFQAFNRARVAQDLHLTIPLALPHLQSISIGTRRNEPEGFTFEQIFPILKMKSMKTVSVGKVLQDGFELTPSASEWLKSPPIFDTKELILKDAWIQPHILNMFVKCFVSLESFSYMHGNVPDRGYDEDRGQWWGDHRVMDCFDPPKFLEAITCLQPSLKSLTILNDDSEWSSYSAAGLAIGNLRVFPQLKHLKISESLLIGRYLIAPKKRFGVGKNLCEILPSSLESLCVTSIHDWKLMYEQLVGLILTKGEVNPRLCKLSCESYEKKVVVRTIWSSTEITEEQASTLKDICFEARVEFSLYKSHSESSVTNSGDDVEDRE